jgi:hypothetical protein
MSRPLVLGVLFLCACGQKDGGGGGGGGGGGLPDLEPADSDKDGFDSTADCNDASAAIFPGATEVCNGLDDDCNGTIDDDLAVTYYRDADSDTYGDPNESATACSQPNGYVTNQDDCDDSNRVVQPGGVEVCDLLGVDENCNGLINDADTDVTNLRTWYVDADEDGYGIDKTVQSCFEGPGMATVNNDCNDNDFAINPGTPEVCDPLDKDEDCDGYSDVDDPEGPEGQPLYYIDNDGDDDGAMSDPGQYFCDGVPPGYSTIGTDCDDEVAIINPRAPENGKDLIDNDCNGAVDDCGPIPDIPTDTADITIEGFSSYSYFGQTLNSMGDLDGDGQADFGVGAWEYDSGKGGVFLFEGPIATPDTYSADDIYAGSLEGDVMYGEFGWSLDTAGDVNSDGFDDVLVGMQSYDKGHAYLFLGPVRGDYTTTSADATWSAEEYGDYAGKTVVGDFDFDADGTKDYAIGANYADSDTTDDVGAAYLIYGPGTGSDTSLADAPVKFIGTTAYGYFGDGLTGVPDMNGDGADELAVGAWQDSSYNGAAYVFYGGSLGGEVSASTADVTITGSGSYQYFGRYLSRADDINNDGYGDLLVEAPSGHSNYGSIYVFLGPPTAGAADTVAQAEFYGEYSYGFNTYSGSGLDGAGDVNLDGYSDVLIGAPYVSPGGGIYNSGIGYLMYGPQTGDVSLSNARCAFPGTVTNDQAGSDMSFIGDQTGDGSPEVLIGSPYASSYNGAAWMVFGDRL